MCILFRRRLNFNACQTELGTCGGGIFMTEAVMVCILNCVYDCNVNCLSPLGPRTAPWLITSINTGACTEHATRGRHCAGACWEWLPSNNTSSDPSRAALDSDSVSHVHHSAYVRARESDSSFRSSNRTIRINTQAHMQRLNYFSVARCC